MTSAEDPIHIFEDGFQLICISEPLDLLHEARLMGNCLNDLDRFAGSEIYSLRNPNGRPVANIEIRARLLIQIAGPKNKAVTARHHSHLRTFLSKKGIPQNDINMRLGILEFDGRTFTTIDSCTDTFIEWCRQHSTPEVIPFQRNAKIRAFLNIFALHGRSAKQITQEKVTKQFTPIHPGWRDEKPTMIENIIIRRPRLPAALHHLTRYGALRWDAGKGVFKAAISDIATTAMLTPTTIYDIGAENRIFSRDTFADLLEEIGTCEIYDAARTYARKEKVKNLGGYIPEDVLRRLEEDIFTI